MSVRGRYIRSQWSNGIKWLIKWLTKWLYTESLSKLLVFVCTNHAKPLALRWPSVPPHWDLPVPSAHYAHYWQKTCGRVKHICLTWSYSAICTLEKHTQYYLNSNQAINQRLSRRLVVKITECSRQVESPPVEHTMAKQSCHKPLHRQHQTAQFHKCICAKWMKIDENGWYAWDHKFDIVRHSSTLGCLCVVSAEVSTRLFGGRGQSASQNHLQACQKICQKICQVQCEKDLLLIKTINKI